MPHQATSFILNFRRSFSCTSDIKPIIIFLLTFKKPILVESDPRVCHYPLPSRSQEVKFIMYKSTLLIQFLPFFYLDKFAYIETQCVIEFKCAKGHKIFVIFGREQIRETVWQMSHVIDHPTQLQGKHSYLKKRKSNEMHLLFCLLFFFQSIHISAEVVFFSLFYFY